MDIYPTVSKINKNMEELDRKIYTDARILIKRFPSCCFKKNDGNQTCVTKFKVAVAVNMADSNNLMKNALTTVFSFFL